MPLNALRQKRQRTRRARRPIGALRVVDGPYAPAQRKVLVATDGSRQAAAAIKLARAMSVGGNWAPLVVTVFEPLPVAVGEVALPAPPTQYETMVADNALAAIKAQLRRYGDAIWQLRTEFGSPAREILEAAAEERPELIVVGLGRHGRLARMLGAETAARVARRASVPVLAVNPKTWFGRSCAVAAVDFGDASLRAARESAALLEPGGRLHLVHVRPAWNTTAFADSEWERAYAMATAAEFARFRNQIETKAGIEITTALVTGDVVEAIVNEAKQVGADLIALGSHSMSVVERLMIGSTPTDVLRAAPCSVLIAPPSHERS